MVARHLKHVGTDDLHRGGLVYLEVVVQRQDGRAVRDGVRAVVSLRAPSRVRRRVCRHIRR